MAKRLLTLLCLLLFVAPAQATWSILILDRRTGEIAMGVATCNPFSNLTQGLPTIVPGRGAGVVQSGAMPNVLLPLYDGILAGDDPADIMLAVRQAGPQALLQAGVVTLDGVESYSGPATTVAFGNYVGEDGDLIYAIQGNVLSGDSVLVAAEQALLATEGDLATKLLASMLAARDQGGDGRCSCDQYDLTIQGSQLLCGDPPPSFTKAAHSAALIVARMGDPLPPCNIGIDCATLRKHLRLVISGPDASFSSPDPILQLVERFESWKAARVGKPDGHLTQVELPEQVPADGVTRSTVRLQLVDREGTAITTGQADVKLLFGKERSFGDYSEVVNHGDGTYSFEVLSPRRPGTDPLRIEMRDEFLVATVAPFPELSFVPPAPLVAGRTRLSVSSTRTLPIYLDQPGSAGQPFVLTARVEASGGGAREAGIRLPGGVGRFDGEGRARLELRLDPGTLGALLGRTLRVSVHGPEGVHRVLLPVVP